MAEQWWSMARGRSTSGSAYVVTRRYLRVIAQIRRICPNHHIGVVQVAHNRDRKALGGGTPAVHHVS